MAWFQTGLSTGLGYNARNQQSQDAEAQQRSLEMDCLVLGERNNQQISHRNSMLKAGHRGGGKGKSNQENALGENLPKVKGSQRHPLGNIKTSNTNFVATGISQAALQPAWVDIDADKSDIIGCTQLAQDIMANMFLAEKTKLPSAQYMELMQPDITPDMRSILIDWLVEVAQEYRLQHETLHLSVRLIDQFLSRQPVARNKLQLVGVTCMFIASKFEEIYAPQVDDFSYITEETYSKQEIVDYERVVLLTLNFELAMPTAYFFLSRVCKAANAELAPHQRDGRLEVLSSYIVELSLLEYESLRILPSRLAAAAVLVAQFCLYMACWNPTLQHFSTYTPQALRPTALYLFGLYGKSRSNPLPAVREKYSQPKFACISEAGPPPDLPESLFYDVHVL